MNLRLLNQPRIRVFTYIASLAAGLSIMVFGFLSFHLTYQFHPYIGLGIIASLTAPSILVHLDFRRRKLIDDSLPRLLDDLARSQEAGMTLLQALEEVSHRRYGPITGELKKLTAELSWGVEFERAFKKFSERIGTDLSIKVTTIILESIRFGGDLKTVFNSTAAFVRELIRLRDEREAQLRPYMTVIYMSLMVFIAIIVILYRSFFLPMSLKPTGFLRIPMSLEGYKALLFDLTLVEAVFGGLTAGKLSKGLTLDGLKHSVILTAAATAILTAFF